MDCFITDRGARGNNAAALEDVIMQKGKPVTAGSKILENFISPIDATVVSRLLENNIDIAGRAAPDEFGIIKLSGQGGEHLPAAVKAVSDKLAGFALCNDIFGTYRRRAAENGLCYIHPTYGTVSRFGLVPAVSSMDQIGIVCDNIPDGFRILSLIAGKDEGDGAMFPEKRFDYTKTGKKIRLGLPFSIIDRADEATRKSIMSFAEKFETEKFEPEYFDICNRVMYILSCAEISCNIARYDGVKFGFRASGPADINDLYVRTRSEGFTRETKLTCIMGAMVLSRDKYVPFYEKAMKLRRLIKGSLRFDEYDLIVLPCATGKDPYENLSLYSIANLAGLPSVSFSHKGGSIQLIAGVKNENLLLSAWEAREV